MLGKSAGALILAALLLVSPPIFARTGVVRGSYVNLRSEGRFNSPIVGKKMRGESYKVLFQDRKWIKVAFEDGVVGWLYQTSTELSGEAPTPEDSSASATATIDKNADSNQKNAGDEKVEKPDSSDKTVKASVEKSARTGKDKTSTEKTAKPAASAKQSEKRAEKKDAAVDSAKKSQKEKSDKVASAEAGKAQTTAAKSTKASEDKSKRETKKTARMARPIDVVEVSGSAEELYNEAIRLYEKKQYVQALDKNRQALNKAPQNAEILNNIGNCQFKVGRIDEALSSWKEALKISPRSGKISNNLGIAYYQLDKNKDAVEYYKKAILFEPDFPDPYYNLASVYGFIGKFEDAIVNYRKFLEFSPDVIMKKLAEERISYCERQLAKAEKKKTAQ